MAKIVNEEWVRIDKYPDYLINKKGDVFYQGGRGKKRYRKPLMVSKTLLKIGYYAVSINGKKVLLHRLLAETFIPNPENKPEIDHIDGNPTNNKLDNLRWATHKENLNNPISVQREIDSHTGLVSNIKGRKKVWIDKENKIYKMI